MAAPQYKSTPQETLDAIDWSVSGNEANFVVIERRFKSAEEPTGVRNIYLAQGGADPDGSSITHWRYTAGSGWTIVEDVVDETRAAIATYTDALPAPSVSVGLTDAEFTVIVNYLTA